MGTELLALWLGAVVFFRSLCIGSGCGGRALLSGFLPAWPRLPLARIRARKGLLPLQPEKLQGRRKSKIESYTQKEPRLRGARLTKKGPLGTTGEHRQGLLVPSHLWNLWHLCASRHDSGPKLQQQLGRHALRRTCIYYPTP